MTSPTFDILQKIAIGLSLDLVDLFDSRPHAAPPGRRSITRRGEGSPHPTKTYGLELLATDLVLKAVSSLQGPDRRAPAGGFQRLGPA